MYADVYLNSLIGCSCLALLLLFFAETPQQAKHVRCSSDVGGLIVLPGWNSVLESTDSVWCATLATTRPEVVDHVQHKTVSSSKHVRVTTLPLTHFRLHCCWVARNFRCRGFLKVFCDGCAHGCGFIICWAVARGFYHFELGVAEPACTFLPTHTQIHQAVSIVPPRSP